MIAEGGRYYDAEMVRLMRLYLDETRLPAAKKDQIGYMPNPLTKREQQVLLELAKKSSNSDIGTNLVITENTVKAHISSIISKLNAKDRHEAVLIAMARGWLVNTSMKDN
jgi:DNA-binding NarL/FixJ family response regulator